MWHVQMQFLMLRKVDKEFKTLVSCLVLFVKMGGSNGWCTFLTLETSDLQ